MLGYYALIKTLSNKKHTTTLLNENRGNIHKFIIIPTCCQLFFVEDFFHLKTTISATSICIVDVEFVTVEPFQYFRGEDHQQVLFDWGGWAIWPKSKSTQGTFRHKNRGGVPKGTLQQKNYEKFAKIE